MYYKLVMNRDQLIRKIRRLARKIDTPFDVRKSRGKGSHVTLILGNRKTTCPMGELKTGTLRTVLKTLGLTENDLQ